ncbi:hypothetical protein SAMN05216570_2569 [Dyella sp. OK004]|uniref:hypothetical protein n=1 Tax=Dyella sp. OK004 TaxID=1855292 RepID=UPI0008EEA5D1|nr:hypothetical protein [Dyella sp. OK004]SFS11805.1 hypothetical protein SAMN05216570_2569 [Dyella sp. OK004]
MHKVLGERWMLHHAGYYADPQATPAELLNDATEWMAYARGIVDLLSELVFEADAVNVRRLSLAMDGVSVLMDMSARSVAQAHGHWLEHARRETGAATATATATSDDA